jgi:hypothetical protein
VALLTGRTYYPISPTLDTEEFAKFPQPRSAYQRGKRLLVMHDRGVQRQGAGVEEVVRGTNGHSCARACRRTHRT